MARQSLGVLEILIVESSHVLPGDVIRLRLGVHHPHASAPCDRIKHLLERNRRKPAVLDRDHRCRPAVEQILGGAIPEIAGVLHVIRDRIGAAQLVPDVF